MAKTVQSKIDYDQVCEELGISIEDLVALTQKKIDIIHKKKVLLETVISDFLKNLEALVINKKRSKATLTTYKSFLNRILNYTKKKYPNISLQEFNEFILIEFLMTCNPRSSTHEEKKDGEKITVSNYTTNKYTAIVRKLFKFAYTCDYIDRDLSHRFEHTKTSLLPRYFNDEQIRTILRKSVRRTYGYRWRAIICFMLGSGCRLSEVTSLKVKDFDIENDLIFIKQGKGNKDRTIPMYPEVKKIVLRYLQIDLRSWDRYNDGYLFSRDNKLKGRKNISDRSLQYQIKNILKDSSLEEEHYSTHSFRHTFAVNCLKAGMKIEYLSQVLGHTNPATTSIYVQLLPADLRDEVMTKYPFPLEELLKEII